MVQIIPCSIKSGAFPKIKIVARGNELKCIGEEAEATIFAERFNEIVEYYQKYHRLEEDDLGEIFLRCRTYEKRLKWRI